MRTAIALLLTLAAAGALGCGPRYARERVFEHRNLVVTLRAQVADEGDIAKDGRIDRGFDHPATISSVRLAHILSRIDVRIEADDGDDERKPAFETVLLYTVGEKMALAFAQADSTQEVVVQAVRVEKRFGIFTAKHLTSFTAWVAGDDLYVALSRVEWEIPKGEDDKISEPWPDKRVQAFKVLPAEGLIPQAEQVVAAEWRNPIFREATHVRVGAGGRLLRKTILLESPPEEGEDAAEEPLSTMPLDLDSETLRQLTELQEQRERGEISESLYLQRRRDLLRKVSEEPPPEPR